MRYTGYVVFATFIALAANLTAATLPRVEASLTVDGDLSDPLWSRALRVDRFWDIRSTPNAEPPVRTVGLAAYDSDYLYIAFRADDPDPSRIRAPLVPRDQVFGDQDMMQIDLDAQDDGKSSTIFRVNARGVQTDGIYTESTEEDDFSPDFDFESATRITPDGWQAELRIPLSSIRYARRDPQTWRIVFYRVYPRDQRYRLRSAPVEKGETCWLCSAPRYGGIEGLRETRSLVLTPYSATSHGTAASGTSADTSDAGVDLKWLAGPSLSIDATLNPDFSQVEADVTRLTVNERFALFYPEKRPFFMEGADLLASPIQAINTRTITAPSWGVRLTGRPGNQAFTLIAASDRGGGSTILPGAVSSSSIDQTEGLVLFGRYRYSFGASSAGFLMTSRSGDGAYNRVFGPDLQWWPRTSDRITAQFLFSTTARSASTAGDPALSGHAAFLSWDRTATHYGWRVAIRDIGAEFRADSGFVPQTGVRALSANAFAIAYPNRILTQIQAALYVDEVNGPGGELVSRSIVPALYVEGWRGTTLDLRLHPREKVQALDGSVETENYMTVDATLLLSRHIPNLELSARLGDEVDVDSARVGRGLVLSASTRMQPASPLFVELSVEKHRLDVDGRMFFDALALSARATWALGSRSSLRLFADGQRISTRNAERSGFLDGTVLYTYQLNWQTRLYVGYGDSRFVDEAGGLGNPRRELFVKASYALRTRLGQKRE